MTYISCSEIEKETNEILATFPQGDNRVKSLISKFYDLFFELTSDEFNEEQLSDISFLNQENNLHNEELFNRKVRIQNRWFERMSECGGMSLEFAKEDMVRCYAQFVSVFGIFDPDDKYRDDNIVEDLSANAMKIINNCATLQDLYFRAKIETKFVFN